MADKAPTTTKLTEPTEQVQEGVEKKEEQKKLPQLGALEDDDEFEVSLGVYGGSVRCNRGCATFLSFLKTYDALDSHAFGTGTQVPDLKASGARRLVPLRMTGPS